MQRNRMSLVFKSLSQNEAFARNVVANFCLPLNPTVDEIIEIKTAVSEAVTNSIVHGYPNKIGDIRIDAELKGGNLYISVKDYGEGIEDIEKALEPFYTSKPEQERTGMGFTVIESFMDKFYVKNNQKRGVTIYMVKNIGAKKVMYS